MVCVPFFTVKWIGECQNARITGLFYRFLNYRMVDFLQREYCGYDRNRRFFELGLTDWTIPNQEGRGPREGWQRSKKLRVDHLSSYKVDVLWNHKFQR